MGGSLSRGTLAASQSSSDHRASGRFFCKAGRRGGSRGSGSDARPAAAAAASGSSVETSRRPEKPALLGSIDQVPVSLKSRYVGRWPSVAARPITSVFSANQAAVVELMPPGVGRLPASCRWRLRPTVFSMRLAWSRLRRSWCVTTGVIARPSASIASHAGPMPVMPRAVAFDRSSSAVASRIAASMRPTGTSARSPS